LVILGALVLLLPAIFNGRPFTFFDINQYYWIGEKLVSKLTGWANGGGGLEQAISESASIPGGAGAPSSGSEAHGGYNSAIGGGRSPLFSLLAFGLITHVSVWAPSVLNCLIGAWLGLRLVDLVRARREPALYLILMSVLSLASSLGFHANFLMPDIYAGFFLAGATLLLCNRAMTGLETILIVLVMAACAFMHSSTIALGLVLVLVGAAFSVFAPSRAQVRTWAPFHIALAVMMATTAMGAYGVAVEKLTNEPLGSPPYLMARVYADGPGRLHLERACAADPDAYAYCAFAGRPYKDHNDLLWGDPDDNKPHYYYSRSETQRAMQADQGRFVLATFAAYPLQQALASLANGVQQFFSVSIDEISTSSLYLASHGFIYNPVLLDALPGAADCARAGDHCRYDGSTTQVWSLLVYGVNIVSELFLIAILAIWVRERATGRSVTSADDDRLLLMGAFILSALVANAMICGALSGPHARYQARLVWMAPLFIIASHAAWFPLLVRRRIANTERRPA
jgi:hypothetical protein